MSLTGDPVTDALVPIAARFVGAVRDNDQQAIDELLAEAIDTTGGRCDPGVALAIVCAALVPEDRSPTELLAWRAIQSEYDRLCAAGIDDHIARELCGMTVRKEQAA